MSKSFPDQKDSASNLKQLAKATTYIDNIKGN